MSNPYGGGFTPYEPPVGGSYGQPGPGAQPYQQSRPTDGISIAAAICALTCCAAPVGVGLGIAGLVRTKGGKRSGRWAAVTGLAVGSVLTLAMIAFLTWGVLLAVRTVDESEARVGQCINIDVVDDLSEGECDEPHDGEIIAVGQFTKDLLRLWWRSEDEFCGSLSLEPEHEAAVEGDDFYVHTSTDAFDEVDPNTGDWYVCYVRRVDREKYDGSLLEP